MRTGRCRAQRTATVARLLADTPPALHEAVIAAASTELARFSLTREPIVDQTGAGERAASIAGDLSAALGIAPRRVRVAPLWTRFLDDDDDRDDDDDDHDDRDDRDDDGHRHRDPDWFTASAALADGRWLNVAVGPPPGAPAWGPAFVAVFLLSALGIAAVAVVMGRRIAKPMRGLANAAGRLGRGEAVEELPEAGTVETRETVRAFNLMRARLDRYVRDRTAMLAAVSHDLRTPITSLRLHAEFVEDAETKAKILAALDEMQRMTGDALAFIREDMRGRRRRGRSTSMRSSTASPPISRSSGATSRSSRTAASCLPAGRSRCAGRCATCWRTRRPMADGRRRGSSGTTPKSASSSRTRARGSRRPTWSGCSSPSCGSRRRAAATPGAAASGSPFRAASCAATAATFAWRTAPKADCAPRSRCLERSGRKGRRCSRSVPRPALSPRNTVALPGSGAAVRGGACPFRLEAPARPICALRQGLIPIT